MRREEKKEGPSLWAEGRQYPRLGARTFARASRDLAKESAARLLLRAGAGMAHLARRLTAGEIKNPLARFERVTKYLPSSQSLGGVGAGVAAVLSRAAARLLPEEIETSAYDQLATRAAMQPVPQRVMPKRPLARRPEGAAAGQDRTAEETGDLAAIRALLASDGAPDPAPQPVARHQIVPPAPVGPMPPAQAAPSALGAAFVSAAAFLCAFGTWGLCLPWGAGRALLLHLKGEDLRAL